MEKVLSDPETAKQVIERLHFLGHSISWNYLSYIKYAGGAGAAFGVVFSIAHILDLQDEKGRKLSRKEKLIYPCSGAIAGVFVGVTLPVWILFTPFVYVFGYGFASSMAKFLVGGMLLADPPPSKKEDDLKID